MLFHNLFIGMSFLIKAGATLIADVQNSPIKAIYVIKGFAAKIINTADISPTTGISISKLLTKYRILLNLTMEHIKFIICNTRNA